MPWPNKFSWLRGSGWVQVLAQADLVSPGIADSFIQAAHVIRTRRIHQVTAFALCILKHGAYDHYCTTYSGEKKRLLTYEQWSDQKKKPAHTFNTGQLLWSLNCAFLPL